jgi:hypothetical protein
LLTTGVIRPPLLRMIITNDGILHPILVHPSDTLLLFDRCPQMALPRGRESPLHEKKTCDMAVATSELIPQFLGLARVEAEVAAGVLA